MSEETQAVANDKPKLTKKKAVAFVGLCIVVCKLPVLLVVLGFGGLGVTASLPNLTPVAQAVGMAVFVAVVTLAIVLFYRAYRRTCS